MATTHKIFNANSSNISCIEDKSVQLIVTSPPYPMIEMWDDMFKKQSPNIETYFQTNEFDKAFEAMHLVLDAVWSECNRVLADNGFICINIGDATRTLGGTFRLFSNHSRIIQYFTAIGYTALPDILWRKQSNAPNKFMGSGMYPAGAYVTYEHEYILVFRKGDKRMFSGKSKQLRQESAYFWEERNVWFSDLWEIKGTSQIISKPTVSRNRSASFPFEVPYRLVNMYSIKGDTVLDPFCGLGTTNLACIASERNSIGIEICPEIATLAQRSIAGQINGLNKLIEKRLSAHLAFIESLTAEKQEKCYQNGFHGFAVKTRQETALQIKSILNIDLQSEGLVCHYKENSAVR